MGLKTVFLIKITEVAQNLGRHSIVSVDYVFSLTETIVWATFWAIFLQTHLVTLPLFQLALNWPFAADWVLLETNSKN
jgi:hypothetical protein